MKILRPLRPDPPSASPAALPSLPPPVSSVPATPPPAASFSTSLGRTASAPSAPPSPLSPPLSEPTGEKARSAALSEKQLAELESQLKTRAEATAQTLTSQFKDLAARVKKGAELQTTELQQTRDQLRKEQQAELQAYLKKFEADHLLWTEKLKSAEDAMQKLSSELSEAHHLITQLEAQQKPVLPPDPEPPAMSESPLDFSDPAPGQPFSLAEPLEDLPASKKVAIFSKLWNYLNQPAIVVPPRRRDRQD